MKTIIKKRRFLAAFTATLLVLTALVTSCMDPLFDETSGQQGNNITQSLVGKGLVRISIVDTNARSILPSLPLISAMYYTVQFTSETGNTSNDWEIGNTTTAVNFVVLDGANTALNPDDYTIVITAWDDADLTIANKLAGWSDSGINVASGASTLVNANLIGWTGTGTGTFVYNITVPALPSTGTSWTITTPPSAYTVKTVEIYDDGGALVSTESDASSTPIDPDLTVIPGVNTKSITLDSGYYTVKITLKAANCQDRVVTNVMHIYNTMASTYTYSVPALNQDKFSVAFNLNGETNTNASYNGTTQPSIAFLGTVNDPGNPENGLNDFVEWNDKSDGTGKTWDFTPSTGTPVMKDTTLYAQWTPKTGTVIDEAAITGVTAPVAGATPVTTITNTSQYTGTITWKETISGTALTGDFDAGKQYTATITLSPKSGYIFTGVSPNFFTVADATSVTNAANSNVVTAEFPATADTITNTTISGVTAPVAGVAPVTTITDTQYTGIITWKETISGTALIGNFVDGISYTATITLTAESGYTTHGLGPNAFTVAGAIPVTNSANSGVITAVFPTKITMSDITGVTPPKGGDTPTSSITDTLQYTATISWSPNDSSFATNTVYTATITITPKTGYTLTGVPADFFTVSGATSTNSANSGVVTSVFPITSTGTTLAITFKLNDMGITSNITNATYDEIFVSKTKSFVFTINGGSFSSVTWDKDGVSVGGSSTGLTIDGTSSLSSILVSGTHTINVKGTKDGQEYSTNIEFTIY